MFVPECAKYWEDSMQIGEFIIRTDLQSLKPVAETFYLFSERQAFIAPTSFIRRFVFYFLLYINILLHDFAKPDRIFDGFRATSPFAKISFLPAHGRLVENR